MWGEIRNILPNVNSKNRLHCKHPQGGGIFYVSQVDIRAKKKVKGESSLKARLRVENDAGRECGGICIPARHRETNRRVSPRQANFWSISEWNASSTLWPMPWPHSEIMNYLHQQFDCAGGETVRVDLTQQANVCLLDDSNFNRYRGRQSFRYTGGLAKKTPVLLGVPGAGRWHVVIDLGGHSGRVSASVTLLN